jgi:hypothetical protein
MEALLFAPTPCWSLTLLTLKFLNVLFHSCELLLQLVSVLFQPFLLLSRGYETSEEHTASAAATSASSKSPLAFSRLTHFLSPPFCTVRQCGRMTTRCTKKLIKYLSSHLTTGSRKITYFSRALTSDILSLTFSSFFSSTFSYFTRDAKLALCSPCSLNLPVGLHSHVHTSFNIQRQFSSAASSIEYGMEYPFLSLRTRPVCFNTLRCWDTAEGVMSNTSAMLLTPIGPLDFNSSIILTRVSTPNALNISEGTDFISIGSCLIKYFSSGLNILHRNEFVKHFFNT